MDDLNNNDAFDPSEDPRPFGDALRWEEDQTAREREELARVEEDEVRSFDASEPIPAHLANLRTSLLLLKDLIEGAPRIEWKGSLDFVQQIHSCVEALVGRVREIEEKLAARAPVVVVADALVAAIDSILCGPGAASPFEADEMYREALRIRAKLLDLDRAHRLRAVGVEPYASFSGHEWPEDLSAELSEEQRAAIQEDTQGVGVGPVELDCEMARRQGWTEEDLKSAWGRLERISRHYGDRAQTRHPERYNPDGSLR